LALWTYAEPCLRNVDEMECWRVSEVVLPLAVPAIHEVAYHFGISDELLDELGWRRGRQACVPRARLPVVGHLRLDGAFPGGAGRSYFSKLGSVFTEPTPHLELCRLNRPLTSRCVVFRMLECSISNRSRDRPARESPGFTTAQIGLSR